MSQAATTPPAAPAKPAPPQAKPEPVRAADVASKIRARFPEAKVDWMKERRLKVTVPPEKIKDVSSFAKVELGFDHISTVSGVDWIAKNELEVVYFVGSTAPGWVDFVLAIAERIPRDNPVAQTLVGVWTGADYNERETHEMLGINFQGHPSPAHLLLPEDWNDLPPLRKDYVSPGR